MRIFIMTYVLRMDFTGHQDSHTTVIDTERHVMNL